MTGFRLAAWIQTETFLSVIVLACLVGAALVSWRAIVHAGADIRHVQARQHRRRTDAADYAHRRAEDQATLILARSRARSERMRFLLLVLAMLLELTVVVMPAIGAEMPPNVIMLLAARKVIRLVLAVLMAWWLWADYRDRVHILAHIRGYRTRDTAD